MTVKWKSGYDFNELTKRFEETRKEANDYSISFEGWSFRVHETFLSSMLEFSLAIPEVDGAFEFNIQSENMAHDKDSLSD